MSDLYKIYCELNSLDGFKSNSERLLAVQIKAANEVASELRAEVLEQARLLDVSAEREAKLLAEIERLRARVEVLTNLLGYFTGRNDDHIRVMFAGNPDAIEDLLSRVDAALKETAP